jgi:hypothetical protein
MARIHTRSTHFFGSMRIDLYGGKRNNAGPRISAGTKVRILKRIAYPKELSYGVNGCEVSAIALDVE